MSETAASRTLADIWSPPVVVGDAEASASRVVDEEVARGDYAQRALAEIWGGQQTVVAPPAPEPQVDVAPVVHPDQAALFHVPESAEGQFELAAAHLQAGQIAAALPLLESVVASLETAPVSAQLTRARATLAQAYLDTRRPRLAIALYEGLLGESSALVSEDQRLGYRVKLALAFRASGDAAVAIEQLEALVAELDGVEIGERLIDAAVELATTYIIGQRIKDGVATYEAALPRSEGLLGSTSRKSLWIRVLLSRAYIQDGQTERAVRSFRDVVASAEHSLGLNDKLTRQMQIELAALLRNQRR